MGDAEQQWIDRIVALAVSIRRDGMTIRESLDAAVTQSVYDDKAQILRCMKHLRRPEVSRAVASEIWHAVRAGS